jgi:hypothetical protein
MASTTSPASSAAGQPPVLAGPSWLAASADDPDVEAFTVLESVPAPPAPAGLDEGRGVPPFRR